MSLRTVAGRVTSTPGAATGMLSRAIRITAFDPIDSSGGSL